MSYGSESASDAEWRLQATSPGSAPQAEAEIASPPDQARASLPERYGIPLLELLVVNTEYVFISWEITDDQLAQARESLGRDAYERRRLLLCLTDADSGAVASAHELHGEVVHAAFAAHGEHSDNVGVIERCGDLDFVLEALQLCGPQDGGEGEHLQCDPTLE